MSALSILDMLIEQAKREGARFQGARNLDEHRNAAVWSIRQTALEEARMAIVKEERKMSNDTPGHRQMTVGEWKVGIDFNPSGNALVADLKVKAAAFIDAAALIPKVEGSSPEIDALNAEIGRLKALAMTNAEDAAMWAVKAATKRAR